MYIIVYISYNIQSSLHRPAEDTVRQDGLWGHLQVQGLIRRQGEEEEGQEENSRGAVWCGQEAGGSGGFYLFIVFVCQTKSVFAKVIQSSCCDLISCFLSAGLGSSCESSCSPGEGEGGGGGVMMMMKMMIKKKDSSFLCWCLCAVVRFPTTRPTTSCSLTICQKRPMRWCCPCCSTSESVCISDCMSDCVSDFKRFLAFFLLHVTILMLFSYLHEFYLHQKVKVKIKVKKEKLRLKIVMCHKRKMLTIIYIYLKKT